MESWSLRDIWKEPYLKNLLRSVMFVSEGSKYYMRRFRTNKNKLKLGVHFFPRPLSRIMDAPKLTAQMKRGGYFLHFGAGFIGIT